MKLKKSPVWVRLDIIINLTRLAIKAEKARHEEKLKILERMLDEFWTWRQDEVTMAKAKVLEKKPE